MVNLRASNGASNGMYGYPLLQGSLNYHAWARTTKTILIEQNWWRAIRSPTPDPPSPASETSSRSTRQRNPKEVAPEVDEDTNQQACCMIILPVSDSIYSSIGQIKTAKEMWDKLQAEFQGKSLTSYVIEFNKPFGTKYDDEKSMEAYVSRIRDARDSMAQVGLPQPPYNVYMALLMNLGPTWATFAQFKLSKATELTELNPDQLIRELLYQSRERSNSSTVLAAQSKKGNLRKRSMNGDENQQQLKKWLQHH